MAQILKNILKVTPGLSTKAYVAELERNSSILQDINEQFRNICGDLELVSFYETLKTNPIAGIVSPSFTYCLHFYKSTTNLTNIGCRQEFCSSRIS